MTLEQIRANQTVLSNLRDALRQPVIQDTLMAMLLHALPSRTRQQEALMGAHPDTALAHSAKYWAGWADAINTLKSLPDGTPALQEEDQEEEYAHALPEALQRIKTRR